ncbi:DUF3048 domain-containing protein [Candidatus Saccharibacteria bacterium]|nr:DUF3048 domain-containing protein [Candidatus Saccharibacteria bacterium]
MVEKNKITITEEELKAAFVGKGEPKKTPGSKPPKKKQSFSKKDLAFLIGGVIGLVTGITLIAISLFLPSTSGSAIDFPKIPTEKTEKGEYSLLTGERLEDGASKTAPVYCIQTPNGTDGGRPQVGLKQAGVIFEAIAEAGITRFAAIYQAPTSAIIGPVRSLRTYYLEWDTPFDCAIVHAGGAEDALVAVSSGEYRDLTETPAYFYRGTHSERLWNNLFTTSTKLREYSQDKNFTSSDLKGFARLTPAESDEARMEKMANKVLDITAPSEGNTSEMVAEAPNITIRFGNSATFNVDYEYDPDSNTYLRSYANGTKHEVYNCPDGDLGERDPEDVCELQQMAPSVVIAMVVQEGRATDGYHESITTIGSGKAYVFQNGAVTTGTWSKTSKADQIKFLDESGSEIKLAPGQTFISAVPNYGSVEY